MITFCILVALAALIILGMPGATAYHVFGPCIPQVNTGVNAAYEVLGVTEEGGTIEEEFKTRPIHSDISGPEEAAEYQQMGVAATIRMKLVAPDEAIITKIKNLSSGAGSGGTEGTPGTPGALLGTSNCVFKLYLPSSTVSPWRFTSCKIDKNGIKEGTEAGSYDLTIRAWRFIAGTANSVANTTLYTRS